MDTDSLIDALRAEGPHPELADRLMLFGQFVGAWDVDITNIEPNILPWLVLELIGLVAQGPSGGVHVAGFLAC